MMPRGGSGGRGGGGGGTRRITPQPRPQQQNEDRPWLQNRPEEDTTWNRLFDFVGNLLNGTCYCWTCPTFNSNILPKILIMSGMVNTSPFFVFNSIDLWTRYGTKDMTNTTTSTIAHNGPKDVGTFQWHEGQQRQLPRLQMTQTFLQRILSKRPTPLLLLNFLYFSLFLMNKNQIKGFFYFTKFLKFDFLLIH